MAGLRPYCSTCHAHYRGIYPVHAATASHIAKARRGDHGRAYQPDVAKVLGITRVNVRRALSGDAGDDRQRVRKHRRSRPNDGTRKVVAIRRYWRAVPEGQQYARWLRLSR